MPWVHQCDRGRGQNGTDLPQWSSVEYGLIRTTICTREKLLTFFNLQSMLMVEQNHVGESRSMHSDRQMLYMEVDRTRGRGECGGLACNGSG